MDKSRYATGDNSLQREIQVLCKVWPYTMYTSLCNATHQTLCHKVLHQPGGMLSCRSSIQIASACLLSTSPPARCTLSQSWSQVVSCLTGESSHPAAFCLQHACLASYMQLKVLTLQGCTEVHWFKLSSVTSSLTEPHVWSSACSWYLTAVAYTCCQNISTPSLFPIFTTVQAMSLCSAGC